MPTPRKYATNAERQAAYRARAATAASSAPLPAVPPAAGSRRWAMLIGQARGLLEGVAGEMTTYESARSDTQARQEYQASYDHQMVLLAASNVWRELSADQQATILAAQGITVVPAFQVADEAGVYQSVQAISLADWRNRTDALQQRFSNVLVAAAKLLEPTTVSVKLPSATLASETEVDEYLVKAKAQLMAEINAGHPVVL